MVERRIVNTIQWCDSRDMTAGCRTNGSFDRDVLLQVMGGTQSFGHDLNTSYSIPGRPDNI
eukprot:5429569-Pyramimonas_sp.AAC.1